MSGRLPDKFLILCNGSLRDTPRLLYSKRKIRGKTAGCAGKGDRTAAETEQKNCSSMSWRRESKSEAG